MLLPIPRGEGYENRAWLGKRRSHAHDQGRAIEGKPLFCIELVERRMAPGAEPVLGPVVTKAAHPTQSRMVTADRDENNSYTAS